MSDADYRAIKPWLVATDIGMLAYWAVTFAKMVGWVDIPGEWLFLLVAP